MGIERLGPLPANTPLKLQAFKPMFYRSLMTGSRVIVACLGADENAAGAEVTFDGSIRLTGALGLKGLQNHNLFSYPTGGFTAVNNKPVQPPNAFRNSVYASLNPFRDRTPSTRAGVEYTAGRKEERSGEGGTANRISFITHFNS